VVKTPGLISAFFQNSRIAALYLFFDKLPQSSFVAIGSFENINEEPRRRNTPRSFVRYPSPSRDPKDHMPGFLNAQAK
jgi:hypothetical protein